MASRSPSQPAGVGRIRAPQTSGEVLAVPSLDQAIDMAVENASVLGLEGCRIAGVPLGEFRLRCRREVLTASRRWMERNLNISLVDQSVDGPLFCTGHQPEFIHPGVWMKNLAVTHLAKQASGCSLNLIVDNDTTKRCAIDLPVGEPETPRLESVPFDAECAEQPWEELRIRDLERFRSFGDRTAERMEEWGISSVISDIWPAAIERAQRCECASVALTAGRVALEHRFHSVGHELPVSEMCQTESFLSFVYELCRRHEEFFEVYNTGVEEYRKRHRIRNSRHPVPCLEQRNQSFELPFWYWRPGDRERAQVFVERVGNSLVLSARGEELCRFSSSKEAIDALHNLQQSGRFRTRALTTTLFARLCFADLFVHGIGGAKYDEITNILVERFFQVPAPSYLTLTATWHLPMEIEDNGQEGVETLQRRLRDLQFNADQYVDSKEMQLLAEQKRKLISDGERVRARGLGRKERRSRRPMNRQRHLKLKELNAQMVALASELISQTESELESAKSREQARGILRSRESAVVLFPEAAVRQMTTALKSD